MPRFSPTSVALFVAALCISWHSAGNGISTAQAGCGDYVHLGRMDSAAEPTATGTTPPGFDATAPASKFPHRPCQGPHCRQHPQAPAAPAPAPTTSGPQRQACLIGHAAPLLPDSDFLIPDKDAPYCQLAETRIERPPRQRS
ncbi:MAG TPA: hypothetical protein VGH74_14000 [Planctomycetaceae bacterium]